MFNKSLKLVYATIKGQKHGSWVCKSEGISFNQHKLTLNACFWCIDYHVIDMHMFWTLRKTLLPKKLSLVSAIKTIKPQPENFSERCKSFKFEKQKVLMEIHLNHVAVYFRDYAHVFQ